MMKSIEKVSEIKGLFPGIVFALVLSTLIGLTALRTARHYAPVTGAFSWELNGHSDFHNGLYLPTVAFRHGDNPYYPETASRYGMARAAPLYSPSLFVLNLPFSWLTLPAADWLYYGFNTSMLVGLAWLAVRMSGGRPQWPFVLAISCLLAASRPGHITLFTGYFTLEPVIGTALALHFSRRRPWLAGVGILLSSLKPTFAVSLVVLMIFRRDWVACAWGIVLSAIFAIGGILWMASDSSIGEVVAGFGKGMEAMHDDPSELPENRWTRVDLPGMVARVFRAAPGTAASLALMIPLLVAPGFVLWRNRARVPRYGATGVSGMIIVLSMLLAIHHHSYDCLLLVIPWIGVTFFGSIVAPELSPRTRGVVSLLTAVPAGNYLSTLTFQQRLDLPADGALWVAITLLNGLCLLAALVILLWQAWNNDRRREENPSQSTATGTAATCGSHNVPESASSAT